MNRTKIETSIVAGLPGWVCDYSARGSRCRSEDTMMDFVVGLSVENVRRGTGGPFAAAVFDKMSGRLVSAGVNCVLSAGNSVLHAEVMAVMLAEKVLGGFSLCGKGIPPLVLVTSCAPCAMCLGAILWSGVKRVVCGARRADAIAVGFEEGPVFPASYDYLRKRGVKFVMGVRRAEAAKVIRDYARTGGFMYNPDSRACRRDVG